MILVINQVATCSRDKEQFLSTFLSSQLFIAATVYSNKHKNKRLVATLLLHCLVNESLRFKRNKTLHVTLLYENNQC